MLKKIFKTFTKQKNENEKNKQPEEKSLNWENNLGAGFGGPGFLASVGGHLNPFDPLAPPNSLSFPKDSKNSSPDHSGREDKVTTEGDGKNY